MFLKPYKIKSTTTLKNSERKQLVQRMAQELGVEEEKARDVVNGRSVVWVRVQTAAGGTAAILAADSAPMLVEVDGHLLPTLHALWTHQDLVPAITMQTPVLPKLQGGAGLFAAGVSGWSSFNAGTVISVHTTDNGAAAVVGRAVCSSAGLQAAGGLVLQPMLLAGDHLTQEPRFTSQNRPKLPLPVLNTQPLKPVQHVISSEEWPCLSERKVTPEEDLSQQVSDIQLEQKETPENKENEQESQEDEEALSGPEAVDALLRRCLLAFIRQEGARLQLPLKTNLLYKNHLMPLCPEGQTMDVKKSSYKKMSKFLEAMQEEGVLEVREVERGVHAVVGVREDHPLVRAATLVPRAAPPPPPPGYTPPRLRELLAVTAAVLPVLPPHRKGDALQSSEVRAALRRYAEAHGLSRGARVLVDDVLAKALRLPAQQEVGWESLVGGATQLMTGCTEIRAADGGERLVKTRLPPITMKVVTRSGNKKMTLVSGLGAYGLSAAQLSRALPTAVGASCGVEPSHAGDVLLIQGDQTHFMAKLLIEKYGLPKKYLDGADKALNKKK